MRGFSLIPTLVLSLVLSVLGGAGMYISMTSLQTTRADVRFDIANNAADAGLLQAVDSIAQRGSCDIRETYAGSTGAGNYTVTVVRQGRICFIRSEGTAGPARVVKTAIIQSYYGVGLYTVRGNVDAELGGSVRLSGCDNNATPTCYVPAFIASGNVVTTVTEQSCAADTGGSGLYGDPAVLSTVQFTDLIPLFFNVNCFNSITDPDCNVGLLQVFEREYGINPISGNQEMAFDDFGIPLVNFTIPSIPASCTVNSSTTLDLSANLTTCQDIRINANNVTITGTRAGAPPNIYFTGGTIYVGNASNFNLYYSNPSSGTGVYLYGNVSDFRLVSRGYVNTRNGWNVDISNGVIIIGPQNSSELDDPASPYIFRLRDNVTIQNSVVFAKSLRLNSDNDSTSTYYILDSLVYVYSYACPSCSRNSDRSSLDACYYIDRRFCGFYAYYSHINIGRDSFGMPRPSLLISNNSTLYFRYPRSQIPIWGAFVGQDITYLLWSGSSTSLSYRGFLVRNFPINRSLRIRLTSSSFRMNFDKDMINTLNQRFWFFRRVQCVQDPLLPFPQMIQTRVTAF